MGKSNFRYLKSREDYLKFISEIVDDYGGIEGTVEEFGIDLDGNDDEFTERIEDYKGDIATEPPSYPAIVYYCYDHGHDRMGEYTNQIFDFVTFEELGLKTDNGIFDDSNAIANKHFKWRVNFDKDSRHVSVTCPNCGHELAHDDWNMNPMVNEGQCPNCNCDISWE